MENRIGERELAPAPRRVPAGFLLAELLPFRWWYLWGMFMIAVALIALWGTFPMAFTATAVATLVVIYAYQLCGASQRLTLLKWGVVATVDGTETLTRGTYYSGTTYYNSYLPVASGWTVQRPRYSGPSTKTKVRYRLNGYQGDIVVRGREYTDGVVLADPRRPSRARCVTAFAYDLDRDETGNWVGRLRPRLVVGMVVWLVVMIGWLTLAGFVAVAAANQHDGPPTATPTNGVDVVGNNKMASYACGGGDIDIVGDDNEVTVTGHCRKVRISGNDNMVVLETADSIRTSGDHNVVTYRSGDPVITNFDDSNTIIQKG
ncbi:DUF3060 domain-containing protein [Mycolicibacterium sarraceniae]|uniref:DUF3060 domain-containing protein n=1 Tax=Mycolicibacterium sarraceniae TaxID=1534348 RepID=A0A7I7SPJ2_9MYCO|nr:DUF3060 domain-containing protein [Mycolicibacterium sarraceniae]BBY57756.1 hypothetical protein MSAR_08920 [Mycolicibacterium sarraceniae]